MAGAYILGCSTTKSLIGAYTLALGSTGAEFYSPSFAIEQTYVVAFFKKLVNLKVWTISVPNVVLKVNYLYWVEGNPISYKGYTRSPRSGDFNENLD